MMWTLARCSASDHHPVAHQLVENSYRHMHRAQAHAAGLLYKFDAQVGMDWSMRASAQGCGWATSGYNELNFVVLHPADDDICMKQRVQFVKNQDLYSLYKSLHGHFHADRDPPDADEQDHIILMPLTCDPFPPLFACLFP